MGCKHDSDGEEHVPFSNSQSLCGYKGGGGGVLDHGHVVWQVRGFWSGRGGFHVLWLGSLAALDPHQDGGDGEVAGNQHGTGKVGANADEAVGMHEQIEEETLVQVLE